MYGLSNTSLMEKMQVVVLYTRPEVTTRMAPGPMASGEKVAAATASGVDGQDDDTLNAPWYPAS